MRSVDIVWRLLVLAVVASGGTGCGTVGDSVKALQQAVTPAAASASGAAGTKAASAAAATPAAPLPAATQRAFDDAARAMRAGRTDDAEKAFRNLARSNPDLPGPHANLGLMLRQAGKLPESAAELEQAVRLGPNQAVYFNQLGVTYRQLGQFAKARGAYEQAIALDPAYAAPLLNLGILLDLYIGEPARALELYGRYLALSPGGDPAVTKWVAELKNRKPAPITVSAKEKS
jgi:Flp pilus assembly protein TadD